MIRIISTCCLLVFAFMNAYSQLSINEIMASNSSTLADELGEYDDWIEIYNAGAQAVDIGGYFISDDPADSQKWQIPISNPAETTIPAGGFLILWADNDPEQGAHHVDFKLSSAGEEITITHQDGSTTIDQVLYSNQAEDISYGRTSDGGANFQLFSSPTPGATNNGGGGVLTFPVNFWTNLAGNSDDAEEDQNGPVDINGGGLRIGENFNGLSTVGIRFQLELPQNAIMETAYLRFRALGDDPDPTNWTIKAQLSSDASAFTSTNFDISSRPTTTSSVSWAPPYWNIAGENGGLQDDDSPNIAPLIQEVINQGGWQEGNSIVFIITGTGMRNAFSGSNTNFAPKLYIEAGIPYPSNPIENIYINELAAGGTQYLDEGGDREDWIELYNANNFDVNLGGLYLTDNYNDLDKSKIPENVIIPANGFLTFFADNDEEDGDLHTNFNLRSKGEEVALAMQLATGLVILDSISFDDAPFMASFGRETDAANNWILFGAPTPDASNNGADLYLTPPTFSLGNGIYQGSQVTEITHELSGVEIRYTTDANVPSTSSLLYSSPLNIFDTQNIRAIAYKPGYAPSQVENAAYVLNETPNIPAIYLTTAPANFFDNEIGIYVDGTNGIQSFCAPDTVNWAQDWERPVNIKMFLPDGSEAFDVNAGVKISGVCSRNNAMKSLAISLREKDYGNGELGYELFENRSHDNYLRFKLRNSGQDYTRMGFRDMVNHALLIDKVDLEYQSGRPSLVFLNGQFWGIHNIREKYTGEFFDDNNGADPNDTDIIKSPGLPWVEIKQGSADTFNILFNFVENNSLVDDTNFAYFESQVDVNEFLNYWIPMTYMANYDWPANNLTVWREQKAGEKWRYCFVDTDGSTNNLLSLRSEASFNTLDTIMVANSVDWPNHSNSTLFLRKLIERDDYKAEFVQRSCSFIGLIYSEERAHHFADSVQALYQPNVQRHLDRWGGTLSAMGGGDIATWEGWIDAYKDFYSDRPDFWRQHVNDYFNLNSTYNLTFVFDQDTPGTVVVNRNEMEMPFNFSNLYFKDLPLRVKAIAKPGAVFSHWLETGDTNAEIDYVGTGDATLTPIFICASGTTPGETCDDGLECTINDIIDIDCQCKGEFQDLNMDGEANEEDCDFLDAVDLEPTKGALKVFPNPVHNNLTVQLDNAVIKTIEVFNTAGIQLSQNTNIQSNEFIFSVEELPQGVYFIRILGTDNNVYFGNFSEMRK